MNEQERAFSMKLLDVVLRADSSSRFLAMQHYSLFLDCVLKRVQIERKQFGILPTRR